jgi:hypothetical protein
MLQASAQQPTRRRLRCWYRTKGSHASAGAPLHAARTIPIVRHGVRNRARHDRGVGVFPQRSASKSYRPMSSAPRPAPHDRVAHCADARSARSSATIQSPGSGPDLRRGGGSCPSYPRPCRLALPLWVFGRPRAGDHAVHGCELLVLRWRSRSGLRPVSMCKAGRAAGPAWSGAAELRGDALQLVADRWIEPDLPRLLRCAG